MALNYGPGNDADIELLGQRLILLEVGFPFSTSGDEVWVIWDPAC